MLLLFLSLSCGMQVALGQSCPYLQELDVGHCTGVSDATVSVHEHVRPPGVSAGICGGPIVERARIYISSSCVSGVLVATFGIASFWLDLYPALCLPYTHRF